MATAQKSMRSLFQKAQLGDALLFFYLLALIRQWFWGVNNNVLAWSLSFTFAFSLWCFGLSKKEEPSQTEHLSHSFYLIVALPLLVIYALRFVVPDTSFDVLNYHILLSERALRGWPTSLLDYDPFPSFNPLSDMATGIYRHIFGYRVGTIVNYLTMIWTAIIVVKFLRPYLKRTWLIHLAVLLILLTEGLLFEINNYMVDLLALPLLLQATYLVLYGKQSKAIGYRQFYIAFILGLSVALKLTNVFVVIPILLVWAQRLLAGKFKLSPIRLILLLLLFFAPLVPYSIYLHRVGEPVVPYLSNVVQSPLGFTTIKEGRWGPIGRLEALIWPVVLYSQPQRTSELPVYAGKIPVGFILAFFLLPFKRVDRNIRALSFIMIVGALLWSLGSGYTRYAFYLEIISGVLLIYLSWFAARLNLRKSLARALSILPLAVLGLLTVFSLSYVNRYEWGMRPTPMENSHSYFHEAQYVFGDYSFRRFLTPEKARLFDGVGTWVETSSLTNSFEALLRPDIPVINLRLYARFGSPDNREAFSNALYQARDKRMFSLCYSRNLKYVVDMILRHGLGVGKITPVSLPYYSYYVVYDLALIEVLPVATPDSNTSSITLSSTERALPPEAFHALITSQGIPGNLQAGSKTTIYVTVKNTSSVIWPGGGRTEGTLELNLGNHWLHRNGFVTVADDARSSIPFDLKPGAEIQVPLAITAPNLPGDYILELDMVQEQVAWFATKGSKTLRVNIKVE